MRLLTFVIVLLSLPSAFAQNLTCTPDVSAVTCKYASLGFITHQPRIPVMIASPATFKAKNESINEEMIRLSKMGLLRNPTMPHDYSENILFVRNNSTCPEHVYISTDAFMQVTIEEEKSVKTEAARILGGKVEDVAVDVKEVDSIVGLTALRIGAYVYGFVYGCAAGQLARLSDEGLK